MRHIHQGAILGLDSCVGVTRRGFLGGALLAASGCLVKTSVRQGSGSKRWYKGMLHCHSYWSDGRAFPEQAVDAYRRLGYDFMSLTDHNRLSMREEAWRGIYETGGPWPQKATRKHAENLLGRFPWTKSRTDKDGRLEVRLTPNLTPQKCQRPRFDFCKSDKNLVFVIAKVTRSVI